MLRLHENLCLWYLLALFVWMATLTAVESENRRANGKQKQQGRPRFLNRQPSSNRPCDFRRQCRRQPSQSNKAPQFRNGPGESNPGPDKVAACTGSPCTTQYGYVGAGRGPVSTGAVNSRHNTFGLANGFIAAPQFFVRRFRPVVQPQLPSEPVTMPTTEATDAPVPSTDDVETTTVDFMTLRKQLFGWD